MAYEPDLSTGIELLQKIRDGIDIPLRIEKHKKAVNPGGSLFQIKSAYGCEAMINGVNGNVNVARQKAFMAGFISTLYTRCGMPGSTAALSTYLLYPLLSDNKALVHWYSQAIIGYFRPNHRNKPMGFTYSDYSFLDLHPKLALLGDWENLTAFAEHQLANPPSRNKTYHIDSNFYLALAKGDTAGMEEQLAKLLKGSIARARNNEPSLVYESDLISSWGIILSKIARLHGYELDVESPWLPNDWLPIAPLDHYKMEIDEFKDRDIFEPLKQVEGEWLENMPAFSPRPLDQPPLMLNEVMEMLGVKRPF